MMYICPFCKLEIPDTIDMLVAHRVPGGVCDARMLELYPELGEEERS